MVRVDRLPIAVLTQARSYMQLVVFVREIWQMPERGPVQQQLSDDLDFPLPRGTAIGH
jgi:hypothetical protein